MNPPDEFNIEIDLPQPWNWKKIRRWMLGIFVVFVTLYEINMHRPWGEAVPGVRLEPLHVYTRADVTPGSFADLLEQAVVEMKKCAIPQKAKDERNAFNKAKRRPWATTDFPELAKAIDSLEPAFSLLEKATGLPTETCFLPQFEAAYSFPYGDIFGLCNFFCAKAARSLNEGNLADAEHKIRLLLRLSSRIQNSSNAMEALIGNAITLSTYQMIQREAVQLKHSTDFERLSGLLDQELVRPVNLTEVLRGEMHTGLKYMDGIPGIYTDPLQKIEWLYPVLGSRKAERQENMKVAYSHALAALEKDPVHGNPGTELAKFTNIQPQWTVFLRPDPISRIALKDSANTFSTLFPKLLRSPQSERALTNAVLAIYQHKLKSGNWPQQLADTMPTVPLDPFADPPAPIQYKLSKDGKSWELTTKSEPKVSSVDLEPLAKP